MEQARRNQKEVYFSVKLKLFRAKLIQKLKKKLKLYKNLIKNTSLEQARRNQKEVFFAVNLKLF